MIVYEELDGSVVLLYPAVEFLETKGERMIGLKDTPAGLPFWMVSPEEVPEDYLFSEAWEIPDGWGEPDGYGSEFDTFEEVQDAEDQS